MFFFHVFIRGVSDIRKGVQEEKTQKNKKNSKRPDKFKVRELEKREGKGCGLLQTTSGAKSRGTLSPWASSLHGAYSTR